MSAFASEGQATAHWQTGKIRRSQALQRPLISIQSVPRFPAGLPCVNVESFCPATLHVNTHESNSMSDKPSKSDSSTLDPPTTLLGILRNLGPGLIIAGSIVGSGELIATTATGATAGIWLLWLIIIGCVIKVFVQVEFGRVAISSGQTTMTALDTVPGPRIRRRGNWLIWYWFLMFMASIAQLGGIVGGVGQALSIGIPVTTYGREYNDFAVAETRLALARSESDKLDQPGNARQVLAVKIIKDELQRAVKRQILLQYPSRKKPITAEDKLKYESEIEALSADLNIVLADTNGEDERIATAKLLCLLHELKEFNGKLAKKTEEFEEEPKEKLKSQINDLKLKISNVKQEINALDAPWRKHHDAVAAIPLPAEPLDDKIWASIIAIGTALILFYGRFGLIQSFSTAMVAMFTLITIINLIMLQTSENWSISFKEILDGLKFRMPPEISDPDKSAIGVALATFGIIGVGASELVVYPYWCLEKGYGRFTGPRNMTEEWASRARGWMRVMRWDAWCSMVVYTFATVAFYLLGAAVLKPTKLVPSGSEMIRYLAVMYRPVFGEVAEILFLFGAFAVLYSTFFVANASHARTVSDALQVMGLAKRQQQAYDRRVRILSGLFPMLCLIVFICIPQPVALILLSGFMQALMLPMLAFAAIYFRYWVSDRRITPGMIWDVFFWVSAVGLFMFGFWAGWEKIAPYLGM